MGIQQMFLGAGGFSGMRATGGDSIVSTTIGGTRYKVHTFLDDGTFTVTTEGSIDALLVGGGGGSGTYGGGGGGGCVIHVQAKPLSVGTYSVVVGDGGSGRAYTIAATSSHDGGSTTFNGYTATGGGAGGNFNGNDARPGANAGGNGAYDATVRIDGVAPSSIDDYDTIYAGNTGGLFYFGGVYPSGGGAGANGDGGDGVSYGSGWSGGDGVQINIDGNNYYWGGGGGGGCWQAGTGGDGGKGGGGGGHATYLGSGTDGADDTTGINDADSTGGVNTGGGAAGQINGGSPDGYAGGSGIVIVRYET